MSRRRGNSDTEDDRLITRDVPGIDDAQEYPDPSDFAYMPKMWSPFVACCYTYVRGMRAEEGRGGSGGGEDDGVEEKRAARVYLSLTQPGRPAGNGCARAGSTLRLALAFSAFRTRWPSLDCSCRPLSCPSSGRCR